MEKKINLEAKKVILIAFGILLISFVYADTPPSPGPIPPIPDHFIGNVAINGQNAPVGTQISVYVDSALESVYSISEAGKYDLYVKSGESGDLIEFKILDKIANSSSRQGGKTVYLDLSITTTPSSPPSSSGGGGGGSPSTTSISPSTNDSIQVEENKTQTPETGEKEGTGSGITGAVIGFLGSGKGITTIIVLIILGIGVMLIKSKTPRWKRKLP